MCINVKTVYQANTEELKGEIDKPTISQKLQHSCVTDLARPAVKKIRKDIDDLNDASFNFKYFTLYKTSYNNRIHIIIHIEYSFIHIDNKLYPNTFEIQEIIQMIFSDRNRMK